MATIPAVYLYLVGNNAPDSFDPGNGNPKLKKGYTVAITDDGVLAAVLAAARAANLSIGQAATPTLPVTPAVPGSAAVVKSVNGTTPDASGNVVVSVPASGATAKRGVYVPAGWGSAFKSARLAGGLVEVCIMGDSTTYGNSDTNHGGFPWYSWVQKIKALALAAGWPDGGHGTFHQADVANTFNPDGDGYPAQSAATGSWGGIGSALINASFSNTTIGNSITIQGKGTAVRVHLPRLGTGSVVTVQVDGGTVYTVNTLRPASSPNGPTYDQAPLLINGLTDGLHTVVITNSALGQISGPAASQPGAYISGGTLPVGQTYYYVATVTSANGESLPTAVRSGTVGANRQWQAQFVAGDGHTGAKLYRATSAAGPFQLVATTGPAGYLAGQTITVTDDGSGTPGANAPATNTLGTLSTANRAEFFIEFIRDTGGVVFHRDATSGTTAGAFFDSVNDAANTAASSAARLGFASQAQSVNGLFWGAPQGSKPQYRNVKLLVLQIGTNDINGATDASYGQFKDNLALACAAGQAAGAEVLLVSPPYAAAVSPSARQYGGRFRTAAQEVAQAHGAAWCDFAVPLGPVAGWNAANYGYGAFGSPHLGKPGYDAEAQFLWDNILSAL